MVSGWDSLVGEGVWLLALIMGVAGEQRPGERRVVGCRLGEK